MQPLKVGHNWRAVLDSCSAATWWWVTDTVASFCDRTILGRSSRPFLSGHPTCKMGNDSRPPTCVDMGVNVKRVVDGVYGASSVISLAEGERTSVDAVGHHVGVTSQRDVAQSQVLTHRERKWSRDLHFIGRERIIQPFFKNALTIPTYILAPASVIILSI